MIFRKFLIVAGSQFLAAYRAFLVAVSADGGVAEAQAYTDKLMKTASNASILQIPSAYKAAVLYNQIPLPSADLVTNGDFATDSDWTKGTGWTISGGSANALNVTSQFLFQPMGLVVGKKYQFTYTISNYTSGGFRCVINGGANTVGTIRTADGTYTEILTAHAAANGNGGMEGVSSATASIDNLSVKQVQDFTVARSSDVTRTNEQGVLEVMGSNVPCIDYSDGFPVLLTQPQSTNLITYSNDFSDASWAKTGSSVVSGQPSPDGLTNAFKLVEGVGGTFHFIQQPVVAVTSGATVTHSIYLKKGERDWFVIGDSTVTNQYCWFDLLNGVIGSKQSGVLSHSIESLSNGFYRCIATYTVPATFTRPIFLTSTGDGVNSYIGDGTSGIYVYGAQLEELSYPTSYIPTTGATATRLADVVTGAGSTSSINSEEGVLVVNIAALVDDLSQRYITISDGTINNRLSIRYLNLTNRIAVRSYVGGSIQVNSNFSVADIIDFHEVVLKWKVNDFSWYLDGVEKGTLLTGLVPAANTLNELSFIFYTGTSGFFYGKTKDLRVYSSIADAQIDLPYIT